MGIAVLSVVGVLLLRAASRRLWPHRVALWLSTGVVGYGLNRDLEPLEGLPITSEAPAVGAAGAFMLMAFLAALVVTLFVDWFYIWRTHRTQDDASGATAEAV